ncbi:MAG: hypothetical protein ACYCO5_00460 [Acidobacteriaceae bacterium]
MKRPKNTKRMPTAFESWNAFWNKDATDLSALPESLIGKSPVSLLKFQARSEPRFIYLDKDLWDDPQSIRLGVNAASLMMNPHSEAWEPTEWIVDEQMLESYLRNPDDTRRKITDAESIRYPYTTFDRSNHHATEGTTFLMQSLVPSPLYHTDDSVNWWERLPRLGVAYTFGSKLGSGKERVTEALLLICAMSAGNRILASRLSMVLLNKHATAPPSRKKRTYQEIAKILSHEGASSQHELWDDSLFLVSKLLFAHHLFYPHDPIVLRLFRILSTASPAAILALHGWENFDTDGADGELQTLFNDLVTDVMFLIKALVRWESPAEHDTLDAAGARSFSDTVKELIAVILAVTCGTPQWVALGKTEYRAIAPPRQLLELQAVTLPVFSDGQIRSARAKNSIEALQGVLRHLSPVVSVGEADINAVTYKCANFSVGSIQQNIAVSLPWLSEYVRARLAHVDLTEKQAN